VITREGFYPVTCNAYAGFGFSSEAPVEYEFPNELGLEGSDLSPLQINIDKIVAGLTTWRPKINQKGLYPSPMVSVEGQNYEAAFANLNHLFMQNLWGDGLPLVPPTDRQVDWILTGTDLAPGTVIAKVPPRGGLATVHSIAVNLALAGGRPEYMPVLMAIVAAIAIPRFQLQNISPSSNSNYIAAVVNGSVAKDIRLNSGYSLIGPDSAHPAGGCIGRALAMILQNLGGAIPGLGAMELYGGMRVTNAVFAEDETGLPEGWEPLCVERGFKKGDNVVTALAVSSAVNITIMISDHKAVDQAAIGYMHRIAGNMAAPNPNVWINENSDHTTFDFAPGFLILPRTWAHQWANLGWSKLKMKEWLRENATVPWEKFQQWGLASHARVTGGASETSPGYLAPRAEQIRIIVAGGAQSAHAYWMEVGKHTELVSAQITLPANWKDLIKAAEADLGPMPPS
jgi:hypothetical protein